MSKFLLLSVCAASFLPSWAAADVTSVTTSSFIQLQGSVLDPANPGNEVGYFNFTDVPASSSGVHIGNGHLGDHQYYQLSVEESAKDIIFANSVSAEGRSQSLASSVINIVFRNNRLPDPEELVNNSVNVRLLSTITPGSFGMYVTDPAANPTFDLLNRKVSDITQNVQSSTSTFSDTDGASNPIGRVRFDFAIAQDNVIKKDFAGTLQLFLTAPASGVGPSSFTWQLDLNDDGKTLGVGLLTPTDSQSALAFGWKASDVSLDLGTLAPGASSTLSYITTVSAQTQFEHYVYDPVTGATDSALASQLFAFSGFGDPIGKQGSISPATSAASLLSSMMASIMGASDPLGPDLINGVNFSQFKFGIPTFDTNNCNSTDPCVLDVALEKSADGLPVAYSALTPQNIPNPGDPPQTSGAPEPSVWALMMLAVGGMGASLRRRRGRATAV